MDGAWLDGVARGWLLWVGSTAWQVTLVALVVLAVALLARRASPRFRYVLWALVLVKLCVPPSLGLVIGLGPWVRLPTSLDLAAVSRVDAPGLRATQSLSPSGRPSGYGEGEGRASSLHSGLDPHPALSLEGRGVPVSEVPSAAVTPALDAPPASTPEFRVSPWPVRLFLTWLAGLVAAVSLLAVEYLRLRRRLRGSVPVEDERVLGAFRAAAERLHVSSRVRLEVAPGVPSPILFGLLRPRVVLPRDLLAEMPPERLLPIFLHELAHHRRRDLWVNVVQIVLQAIYWFHPLVWLANLRLRAERELIVDDLVLLNLKGGHETYGASLVQVLRHAVDRRLFAPGCVGVAERDRRLDRRLKRILDTKRRLTMRLGWSSVVMLVVLAAVLLSQGGPLTTSSAGDESASVRAERVRSLMGTRGPSSRPAGLPATPSAAPPASPSAGEVVRPPSPQPRAPWPVRLQTLVYEVKIAPERLAELDVQALAGQTAGAEAFKAALGRFGPARVLYRVDQAIDLSGQTDISMSERRPVVTGVQRTASGGTTSTISYQDIGGVFKVNGARSEAGPDYAMVNFNIELSDIGDTGPQIAPNVHAPPYRRARCQCNSLIQFGRPFATLSAGLSSREKDAPTVAYIVWAVLTETSPPRRRSADM